MQRSPTTALIVLVVLNLSIFAIRTRSLLQLGHLTTTTGTEGPMIYGVWKVTHHYPLYEDPHTVFFSNTLYNFLFYRSYAMLPHIAGFDGPALVLMCRLTTAVFGLLGAALGLTIISSLGGVRGINDLIWACSASILFWFGTSPVGWFGLSVRPDLGAVFFAGLGLLWFVRFLGNGSSLLLLLSSLSFFLAWSFKQSTILTFAGTLLVILMCRRQWKSLILQCMPFVIGALTVLYVGGASYRFNTITVPTLGMVNAMGPVMLTLKTIVENPLLYVIPMFGLAAVLIGERSWWKRAQCERSFHRADVQLVALGTIFLVALAGGTLLCLRVGSDRNYFFEAGMIGSIALFPSAVVLLERFKPAGKWIIVSAIGMGATVCFIQLGAFVARSGMQVPLVAKLSLSGKTEFGRLRLLSHEEEEDRKSLALLMSRAPKPILIVDDIFSQPWYSTDYKFPAFVVDPNVLTDLRRRNVIKDDRMATLVELRYFCSLVLKGTGYTSLARQSGYEYVADARGGELVFSLGSSRPSR